MSNIEIHSKIADKNYLLEICRRARSTNKKIVLVFGCFDLIHVGHVFLFENARKLGDILLVGLLSDSLVAKRIGTTPAQPIKNRMLVVAGCENVDLVFEITNELAKNNMEQLFMEIRPDIVATSSLNKLTEREVVAKYGAKFIKFPAVEGISSRILYDNIVLNGVRYLTEEELYPPVSSKKYIEHKQPDFFNIDGGIN